MPLHANLQPANGIHMPFSFIFADAASRTAFASTTSDDLHKIALQLSDKTVWRIDQVNPVVWVQWQSADGGGGGGTTDHAALSHLDYANSGHTGFAPTLHGHTEKADIDSPTFTGIPKAPTAAVGTNSKQIATCEFVLANAAAGGSTNATQLQGYNVANTTPSNGYVLKWSATNSRWEPAAESGAGGYVSTSLMGVANGVATLDANGKVLVSQIPLLAINNTFVVNTQAAMLALVAQVGDIAVRTDVSKNYVLAVEPASVLSNWTALATPAYPVISVFGRYGDIQAQQSDYSAFYQLKDDTLTALAALATAANSVILCTGVDSFTVGKISEVHVAPTIKDGAAATPCLRSLGSGSLQAAPGDHTHGSSGSDYDVAGCFLGKPTATATIWLFVATRAFTIAAQAGAVSPCRAKAGTAATASTTFTLKKNGTSVGTFAFSASGTEAAWTISSSVSVVAGDILSVDSPAQDSTLANVMWTVKGEQ